MKLGKYKISTLLIGLTFFLSGCVPILIGVAIGGGAKAVKAIKAKNKRNELETKEEYGKYRLEMQQKNIEPILSYGEWLKIQEKNRAIPSEKKANE